MGIHGLMKLLSEECPGCVKEQELENFTGRRIAIDASMAMYQFLIAVRSHGQGGPATQLTNEAGDVTSHIQGMFSRTIRLMTEGIKPVYVFDGKPPKLKGGELAKRLAKRAKAEADLAAAKEAGETEDIDRFSRRLVKCTRQHNEDCKKLLGLMGVPVITAPCEAEAQCAELAKAGKVYGVATEDMDALTFRTPKLLRRMTFSGAKQPILEVDLDLALTGLDITYEQFVDLCILCGCDYTASIKGIGPKTALKLIRQLKNIEAIVKALKGAKKHEIPEDWFPQRVLKESDQSAEKDAEAEAPPAAQAAAAAETVPEETSAEESCGPEAKSEAETELEAQGESEEVDVDALISEATQEAEGSGSAPVQEDDDRYEIVPPMYVQARGLFLQSEVLPAADVPLAWNPPDEEQLRSFLVDHMGFNAERVGNGIKKLVEAQQKKSQKRMDAFFSVVPQDAAAKKRKLEMANSAANKKVVGKGKGKGSFGKPRR